MIEMVWDYNKQDNLELYNMDKDRTEIHNLSGQKPERVIETKKMRQDWDQSHFIKPWFKNA